MSEWLPTYCGDPKRQYALEGFVIDGIKKVALEDARDFLRALACGVVTDSGGGRFQAPRSSVNEVIFWEHEKAKTPRPITLWLEPIITIASVARLHLDYGWPKELLGMQSAKWEFDLMAFPSGDAADEYIAGEVKKTAKELDVLLKNMKILALKPISDKVTEKLTNANNKCLGLVRRRAPVFWAVGPGGLRRVFKVSYLPGRTMRLTECADEMLEYSKPLHFRDGS